MRLPCLAGDDASISRDLTGRIGTARMFQLQPHMGIACEAFSLGEAGGRQYLNPMAEREDPFPTPFEFPHHIKQPPVVPQVFRRAASEKQDGVVLVHVYFVEG